jgi:hypothetical protein
MNVVKQNWIIMQIFFKHSQFYVNEVVDSSYYNKIIIRYL